ncbi:histidine phosphatase superfamily [Xylaria bambusicola]|uniref:histidine phosphatase superfamily n=1 Tax=Xylaria bambusicola TaxID=326684 RepID=UPI002008E02C|nr:histidine phosphatase superfamily [Xylaria bambusicola]KAI0515097.1 histidine phosphatase superfamily [Xylaria bambusicola]
MQFANRSHRFSQGHEGPARRHLGIKLHSPQFVTHSTRYLIHQTANLTASPPTSMTSVASPPIAPACPGGLSIEQVQIFVRHGERSPISARFQNTGLSPYWPYCSAAQRFTQVVMATQDGSRWESMIWKRCLETSGPDGRSTPAKGAGGETTSICMPGELTDRGRETSLAFGKSLRRLYVDQLSLLPKHLPDAEMLYIRTTEVPRVIESVQQVLHGLYPLGTNRTSAPWDIAMRSRAEETLLPRTQSCARLAELTRAFSQAAAEKWNGSDDMRYLSEKLGKWMPGNKAVAVDSRPRLFAIMDTINATLAHGPETRLPDEFYDERVRRVIDQIVVDQMFRGYGVSRELRMLGVGQLMGDMVLKMLDQVEWNRRYDVRDPVLQSRAPPRLSLLGCHDRTIGIVLASLGCLDSNEKWPPFTSHITLELFRKRRTPSPSMKEDEKQSIWRDATTSVNPITNRADTGEPRAIRRLHVKEPTTDEIHELDEYFVRVRYNDRIMTVPGCRAEGKHFDGDASLCSLSSFKSIVDKFTPRNWKRACNSNLGASSTMISDESAGY